MVDCVTMDQLHRKVVQFIDQISFINFILVISSYRWPKFHWQILHVGPDGCIRGSLEPYKFMKGPCINDGKWHHIALSASSDWQCMFVDGHVVCSINFGIGHELHRCFLIGHRPFCRYGSHFNFYCFK